ncbi:MAG: hypothetical protein JXR63_06810 [Spirochaetales bacterium]|nr:hypothetical protein [Spirochaetales bacterium]
MNISEKIKELDSLQRRVSAEFNSLIKETDADKLAQKVNELEQANAEYKKKDRNSQQKNRHCRAG